MTDFRINVVVDPSGARTGNRRVRQELDKTSNTANRLRQTLVGAFGVLGLTAGVGGAIRLLAEFEQELSTVRAITGATEQQFQALREEAQRLGTTTRFSATQAAEGLTFLARAGFEADEALAAIEGTLQLAQAGGLDLGSAADIASNALTGFRLNVEETQRVVDGLALAANSSNTNVFQLGDALKFVAPVAAGVGVEIEEATAAIGALSNAGLQASLAGTGLRRVISELESPSTKTRQILQDLGLTANDVSVSQVGLTEALQRLADAGVDTGTALEIFGDRGGPAFEVLSNSIGDVRQMTVELQNADGTAARIAETMDDNLNGALLAVRSAFEGLILAFGETGTTSVLTQLLLQLAGVLRFLAENAEATGVAVAFVSSILLTRFVPSVNLSAISLTRLNTAAALNPFTLLVTGAAAAVAGLSKLNEILDETTATLAEADQGADIALTEFGRVGDDILRVQQNIARVRANIENDISRGNPVNEGALKLLERYQAELAELQGEQEKVRQNTDAATRAREAERMATEAVNKSYEEAVRQLNAEADVLRQSTREREISNELLQLENQLRKEGAGATPEQLEELRVLAERNAALRDQARALDEINGPSLEAERRNAALNALLEDGRITTEQYADAVRDLSSEFEGFDLELPDFPDLPDLNLPAGGGPGGATVAGGGSTVFPTTDATNFLSIQEQINNAQALYAARQVELRTLLEEGTITQAEYNLQLAEASIAANQFNNSLGDGLANGLNRIKAEISDVSGLAEQTLVNAFSSAEDALVSFVTTGEADFGKLVDSILQDLTRLLIRQALLSIITGGAPVGGIPAAADGTISQPANQPILVGEEGPEIFNPATSGAVIPNDQTMAALGGGQQAAPQVNVTTPPAQVQVAVVKDPDEVRNFLRSDEGQQEIIDVQRKNQSTLAQLG